MKKALVFLYMISASVAVVNGQASLVEVVSKTFEIEGGTLDGQTGYLEVLEDRNDLASRKVRLKYVWLKSLAENPKSPVIYLEGGGGLSTWQADEPGELSDWTELLQMSDLIFLDRRGSGDEALTYIWQEEFPKDFFVTEEAAYAHYEKMMKGTLQLMEDRGVEVTGYTIESHAQDVEELMSLLELERYSVFGFSYGSHIGLTLLELFPDRIDRAVFAGADAPNQSFNYPSYLESHIDKLAQMISQDATVNQEVPDFRALVERVMKKLADEPVTISVTNPLTNNKMDLLVGAFGLGFVLRLDIDDYNDIPVLPRLFYSIDQGDYEMLAWFVQKRLVFSLATSAGGINQQLASGASAERWARIEEEAKESLFGNAVNFPFSAAKEHWPPNTLSFDPSIPVSSDIPTLFITGDLDCRTPVEQVEETIKGFRNAIHVVVKNAGHEQAHWDSEVADQIIPSFLLGKAVETKEVDYGNIEFLKVSGKAKGHPSLR